MSSKITERTLYPFIERVFNKLGWKSYSETGIGEQFPDLIFESDENKIVSEVKINGEIQLTKAIIDADSKARKLGTRNSVALLFPSYIRQISLVELERNYTRLKVSALFLTDWFTDRKELALEDLAQTFTTSYKDWLGTKKAVVSYDLVVNIARDSVREIGGYLRHSLTQKPVFDSAMAVVGRFDIYKNLLEDFSGANEEDARLYAADITAYILVNQLLFYQIVSEKRGYDKLPDVDPINPPKDFLDILDCTFKKARDAYPHILGFDLFPILHHDYRLLFSIARLVSVLKAVRPHNISEDLFGRLYHSTIPPETRKNLGAFYTKPEAAKLLSDLAIAKWDEKVLDPACGSGTLLVEAYHRKAKLAVGTDCNEIHKMLIDQIYGIDVMRFASHMTSMNLTAQNIDVISKPHVLSQDGIEAIINATHKSKATHRKSSTKSIDASLERWLEIMQEGRIPLDFDVVIMNPPFTRRERIPADKEDLNKLVPEVKGKTGYWAYFMVASDKLLKENGTLAVVTPEEFFVGNAAQSVRDFLLRNGYGIKFVVRSAVEVAFSESARYRDYLAVFQKNYKGPISIFILKNELKALNREIDELASGFKDFHTSLDTELRSEKFDAVKMAEGNSFLKKHLKNLKPLVGFNTITMHLLALELLESIVSAPTFAELALMNSVKIRLYRPGQYQQKGVEKLAEKLFTSKYRARSPNVTFLMQKIDEEKLKVLVKNTNITFDLPLDSTVLSLRTYSGVSHFNITGEEERGIIDDSNIPQHIMAVTGLLPRQQVKKAEEDIKSAYSNFAGRILIGRRVRLTSRNAFWLAFYSDNRVLGSQLPNVEIANETDGKIMALYLNSTIVLVQLIAFAAETEGSYVSLDHARVWSNIHVPQLAAVSPNLKQRAIQLFNEVGKATVRSFYERIGHHDDIQRSIDELALELIGSNEWKPRLDELYDAVANELQAMEKIRASFIGKSAKQRKKEKIPTLVARPLDSFKDENTHP